MDKIDNKIYKARFLDIVPFKHEDEDIFIVRDPFMFSPNTLSVTPLGYVIIANMDGNNSVGDIKQYIFDNYNLNINTEQIIEIAEELDKIYFLDNERFNNYRIQIENIFKNTKLRKMTHIGLSYPYKPEDITSVFDGFFDGDFGIENGNHTPDDRIEGLIIPHIDLRIGGKIYADAYREIIPVLKNYKRFVIFGTSHHGPSNMFALTDKDFETPFGDIKTDEASVSKLNNVLSFDGMEDEIVHRTEHSIEFQTVFLKYLQAKYNLPEFEIVPVLFGSFMVYAQEGKVPEDYPDFNNFLGAVRNICDENTCIIASVDLAHVGKKFGDAEGINKQFLDYVYKQDMSMMEAIKKADPRAFWESVVKENDKRKVCGFSPIYTLLKLMEGKTAKKYSYDKNIEEMTESMVSYAGVVF
jgi:hypothetical protein